MTGHACPECGRQTAGEPGTEHRVPCRCGVGAPSARLTEDEQRAARTAEIAAAEDFDPLHPAVRDADRPHRGGRYVGEHAARRAGRRGFLDRPAGARGRRSRGGRRSYWGYGGRDRSGGSDHDAAVPGWRRPGRGRGHGRSRWYDVSRAGREPEAHRDRGPRLRPRPRAAAAGAPSGRSPWGRPWPPWSVRRLSPAGCSAATTVRTRRFRRPLRAPRTPRTNRPPRWPRPPPRRPLRPVRSPHRPHRPHRRPRPPRRRRAASPPRPPPRPRRRRRARRPPRRTALPRPHRPPIRPRGWPGLAAPRRPGPGGRRAAEQAQGGVALLGAVRRQLQRPGEERRGGLPVVQGDPGRPDGRVRPEHPARAGGGDERTRAPLSPAAEQGIGVPAPVFVS